MQVKSIAEHSLILSIFIMVTFVFKAFVLLIFDWPLNTGFTIQYDVAAEDWLIHV